NIVIGHHPKAASHIASIGANRYFDLTASVSERMSLGAGLQAIRGFFVSVRAATARVLVNVQVKHAAFYEDGPLDRIMAAHLRDNGQSKTRLANFLKKLSVDVTHIVRHNRAGHRVPRIKQIVGLVTREDGRGLQHPPIVADFGAGPKDVKFFLNGQAEGPVGKSKDPSGTGGKKGKKPAKAGPERHFQTGYISVYDFFRQRHNITVSDTDLPVVNVGSRQNPSYLPAQVCVVRPGQHSNEKLSRIQTQQMIRFAVRKPHLNAQSIVTSGARMIGVEPTNPTLDAFEINVTPRLITVPGRVLSSPSVKYGGQKLANPGFGSWNMLSMEFAAKANLSFWTYLWISPEGSRDPWQNEQQLKHSLDALATNLRRVGLNANDCSPGLHVPVTTGNFESEIDAAIHRFTSHPKKPRPGLLLVITSPNNSPVYNRVKYACDVKEGVLNVCVDGQKFARANDQYLANVALKINLKLGGRNQFLDSSKLGILSEGKTMVVGIDVTHPSPGSSSNAPSVAAIVASIDKWLGQWPAELQVQNARQEMVSGLNSLLKSRLRLWAKFNTTYPQNILVYRDGVSEGQYNLVLNQELPDLRKACEEVYPAAETKRGLPHITIVIVGKNHHTRFYPTKNDDADRSSNPKNGTVVDRGVTEAKNWDFFLQAHAALQGTARPAHYYIVHDEIFQARKVQPPFSNAADVVEDLTHNLCYLFGRATKAVSICTPAYYADLVCARARCYLSRLFDPSPVASPVGSVVEEAAGTGQVADQSQVRIHENVRDAMFYI
ncbi:ribonuclease H-like domain-containing protein, partial [Macrophomina phaseolina]